MMWKTSESKHTEVIAVWIANNRSGWVGIILSKEWIYEQLIMNEIMNVHEYENDSEIL
jgi:hypothetical protein